MRPSQPVQFVALLASADLSQAGFTRVCRRQLPRSSQPMCRGLAALPRWAAPLAVAAAVQELSAETPAIKREDM